MLSVYMAVRVRPFPKLPPARAKRVRSLDPDIARVKREGIAAPDAVPLEQNSAIPWPLSHVSSVLAFNAGIAYNVSI